VRCHSGRATCGVAVTAIAPCGVMAVVAVIMLRGVAVAVVALHGAAVVVTVVAQLSWSQSLHVITIMPLSS